MYTHDEIFAKVKKAFKKEYDIDIFDADNPKGKVSYSEEEAISLAKELVDKIENSFISIQKHGNALGRKVSSLASFIPIKEKNGKTRIEIRYPSKYFFRPSLWRGKNHTGRTGSGINDIYALFTHGYVSSKPSMPKGYWESTSKNTDMGFVRAPKYWPPNPFIQETIKDFEKEHYGLTIDYSEN